MLISAPGMVFGLTLASIAFHCACRSFLLRSSGSSPSIARFEKLTLLICEDLTKKTGGILVDGTKYDHSWSGVVLFAMITYVAFYAMGLGNIPWQQGEFFSLEGTSAISVP